MLLWRLGGLRSCGLKTSSSSLYVPDPLESRPISFDMPLLHLSFLGPLMRCRYSWAFPVSRQMTVFAIPGCNVRLPVTWSITAHSSPSMRTRGAGLLGV